MIKTWQEVLNAMPDDTIVTNKLIRDTMQDEIDELREALTTCKKCLFQAQEAAKNLVDENSKLRAELGDLPESQSEMLTTIKNLTKERDEYQRAADDLAMEAKQLRDASVIALEALEYLQGLVDTKRGPKAISAIQSALAEKPAQQQEPLEYWNAVEGWVKIDEVRQHFESVGCGTIYKTAGEGRVPLCLAEYHPPREQVEQPAQQQEPVAWRTEVRHGRLYFHIGVQSFAIDYHPEDEPEWSAGDAMAWMEKNLHEALSKLSPPKRKPLSENQLRDIVFKSKRVAGQSSFVKSYVDMCRMIEQAHGIKEQP